MKTYTVYAAVLVALWAASAWKGWDFPVTRKGFIPADVRQAPGGYRSFNYWRGGK
jgi:hypothetical protein